MTTIYLRKLLKTETVKLLYISRLAASDLSLHISGFYIGENKLTLSRFDI